jgi:hypothetical protein
LVEILAIAEKDGAESEAIREMQQASWISHSRTCERRTNYGSNAATF